MLRNLRIRTRLLAGFVIVTLFLVVVGTISLQNINEQRKIMADFHEHPFKVTNAIREAQENVIKMHRGMKDAVLYASNRQELEATVKMVEESEKIVYEELALARERFLGDKTKID